MQNLSVVSGGTPDPQEQRPTVQNEWPEPKLPEDLEGRSNKPVSLLGGKNDILTEYAKAVARKIQYPRNSAFMHGMGVIASAMTKAFTFEYYGGLRPVTLYVVTAQPPSSGKSGINSSFVDPVRAAFKDYNKKQRIKRNKIERKIADLTDQVKKQTNERALESLDEDIGDLYDELSATPIYKHAVSNSTPEALENLAAKQNGCFNVVSDEAGSINVLIGNIYSDRASNADITLQGWDGDYMSVERVTRKAFEGYVRGSIAVAAQSETIQTILEAGLRGNGLSERFLMLQERNLLGTRDHSVYKPIPQALVAKYVNLVNKLVHQDAVTLKFSAEARKYIIDRKNEIEQDLSDGGRYSHNTLRGVVGKMDKQVMKMSCVLHVAEHWAGDKAPLEIDLDTVTRADFIFEQLVEMYVNAADSQGYIGELSEIKSVVKSLQRKVEKGQGCITVSALRDLVKKQPIFKGRAKLAAHLKEVVLPIMQERGIVSLVENKVFINPKIV